MSSFIQDAKTLLYCWGHWHMVDSINVGLQHIQLHN